MEASPAMPSTLAEILLIFLLLLANGLFAMSEIAVVSARRVRLQQRAAAGDVGARTALALSEEPTRFLSTVQIGITLVGILAGAFGGATLAASLADRLRQVAWLAPYSDTLSVIAVVLLITYLSLVIGELVPKRLALNDPERIAAAVARPMTWLSVLAAPAARWLEASTEAVLWLLRVRTAEEVPVTEEEIKVLIEQGTQRGVFAAAEQQMVTQVFRLADRRVDELMTPRPRVIWLDVDDPPEANWARIAASPHSYYPVCQGDLDQVLGLVSVKELWAASVTAQPLDLRRLMSQPLLVPEQTLALKLLEQYRQAGKHLALAVDEFGGIQGLITLTDILEAIVGDMPTAEQPLNAPIVRREDGSYLVDGILAFDEFKDRFQVRADSVGPDGDYQTLGGFVMAHLGRIPREGDKFPWHGFQFEVVDMDGLRVDKVLVVAPRQR